MATLHVRSVPDELYAELQELAALSNTSLSAEVVSLLQRGVEQRKESAQQLEVLARIRRRSFRPPPGAPTSLELLREDRDR